MGRRGEIPSLTVEKEKRIVSVIWVAAPTEGDAESA